MDQNLFNKIQGNFKEFIGTATQPPIEPKVFTFNSSHIGRKLSDIALDIRIKSLIYGGMPKKIIRKSIRGKRWGWEVTVKKITDYEKTSIFGYGDDGIGYHVIFTDKLGNDFVSIINTTAEMKEGDRYAIDGTLTKIGPVIRLVRVKIIKDLQHPEMIKLAEILTGLEAKISAMPGGIVIRALHNGDTVGKLQVGWERDGVAMIQAADANIQKEGIGTFLYEQLKEFLDGTGIQWIVGAVEGSGVVKIRERVFGKGNTHYFSRGGEISYEEAVQITDVEFGRVIAKTKVST